MKSALWLLIPFAAPLALIAWIFAPLVEVEADEF